MLSAIFRESQKMTELLLEIYGKEIPPHFQHEGKKLILKKLIIIENLTLR